LRSLLDGNNRYATNDIETFDEDTRILRDGTVSKQPVAAAVLACTDLAEPVELIFDQAIGRIRTVKTPGNIVTRDAIATLEYAVSGLGAAVIVVLSHSGCAAVAAAIKARPPLGKPGPYAAFAPAILEGRGNPVFTARVNALIQVAILRDQSKEIAARLDARTLSLVGGYFDAESRRVAIAS
jgi:carbonic anhydrase